MADAIRSALFVDFDNIYIGLKKADAVAAKRFATEPTQWLEWLQTGISTANDDVETRRILMRLCYLNPKTGSQFRSDFIRAGFRVIDCPSLTRQGKNSADIFMVLDIVDAMNHTTSFEEFIVMSGDADFTPVLLRLRDHDRRTVVVSIGHTPTAYSACCDRLIDDSEFIEHGLGDPNGEPDPVPTSRPLDFVLKDLASRLAASISSPEGMEKSKLPKIFRQVAEFRNSTNWLGFEGLDGLLVKLVSLRDDIELREGSDNRISNVTRKDIVAPRDLSTASGESVAGEEFRDEAAALIQNLVRDADAPLPLSSVTGELMRKMGEKLRACNWIGAGGCSVLVENLAAELELAVSPGKQRFVYDASRHQPPQDADYREIFQRKWPTLFELATRIKRVTDTPLLTPDQYRFLFKEIASEFETNEYQQSRTSRAVRDRCIQGGTLIGRSDVMFILRLLQYSDHGFEPRDGKTRSESIAETVAETVAGRCEGAQMALTTDEYDLIVQWFLDAPEEA